AVWNRDNGDDKWNLFKGKINNNEETYPSRTAFYALLKYYENPNGDNKTTLAQWMRLVWNIVENYVESEDSYIPALQLIDYIAENNFDITQLGDDYKGVAKYQVKEEIAKAKQIISGGTEWESKIIEAEKYAFFKGAIRFLFTDTEGNINWNDFNTKWRNAQKYFDNDGVKNEYKDKSILLRSLLSRVNISDQWFGNYKNFWHKELLNTTILPIIHYLLTTEQLELNTKCEAWVNDNYLLESLLEEFDNWHILKNWRGYSVLTRYSRRESNPCSPTEIIVLNYHRNNILQSEGITVKDDCKIKSSKFLYGWDIDFKYRYRNEEYFFQWYGNPNEKELDIYLMKKEWNGYQDRQKKQKNKRTDEDEFYCFRVTENMELPNFIKKLDETIKQYKNENVK
ncbi:MAG: hypothetical protein IKP67_04015, partial [Spirochaetales bacterium]|nr:hypothetical protein [Spirochaetales bacterium]